MAEGRTLSHREAQRFYDRFGARQDSQAFYERPALERLLPQLELGGARALLEFGCGTGRLAAELLAQQLPAGCRYLGIDSSRTMVELARARVAPFGARAEVRQSDGSPRIAEPDRSFDRFVTSYVLDLLSEADIRALLVEAERVLAPGALLGVVGLTHGETPVARAVGFVWERIHRLRPALVGGCRAVEVAPFLRERAFRLRQRSVLAPYGIASEVVVAEREWWIPGASPSLRRSYPVPRVHSMTKALKKAFDAASELPESAQDELAAVILAEIEAEKRFDAALAGSGEKLERLADEAVAEHRANETESLDDLG